MFRRATRMPRLACLAALVLAGCDETSRTEVAWADSPDHKVHAILLETNGGATTSFGYLIALHPADHRGQAPVPAGRLYGTRRSDCAYGVDLRWRDPATLLIDYESTQWAEVPPSVMVGGRRVRLMTRSGRDNPDAPCGGMARD